MKASDVPLSIEAYDQQHMNEGVNLEQPRERFLRCN